ncbi:MAG: hypothetical protein GX153_06990 [Clostridiaceae bacterium]|nr:hypothetical protein [Clostridiaceae bacterium]
MKLYTVDKALLTDTPEIRIGAKVYKVDNRLSTVKKVGEAVKEHPQEEMDATIRLCLGEAAYKEIIGMDLPAPAMQEIVVIISAAVSGITVEEAKKRFLGA